MFQLGRLKEAVNLQTASGLFVTPEKTEGYPWILSPRAIAEARWDIDFTLGNSSFSVYVQGNKGFLDIEFTLLKQDYGLARYGGTFNLTSSLGIEFDLWPLNVEPDTLILRLRCGLHSRVTILGVTGDDKNDAPQMDHKALFYPLSPSGDIPDGWRLANNLLGNDPFNRAETYEILGKPNEVYILGGN